jgi:GNAT superfamily N-acetyltransferase
MFEYNISQYTPEDDSSALALEESCTQGDSIVLRYRRPNFLARSKVYDNYRIICARLRDKVVGITAWTIKDVKLHGERIRAVYLYDTRVHPDYRKRGATHHLMKSLWKDIGTKQDCIYTLVAGDNERCLKPIKHLLGLKFVIPLTILVIPVYKKTHVKIDWKLSNAIQIHNQYLKHNPDVEFLPDFKKELLLGYTKSVSLDNLDKAGCTVWTSERLLSEEVVRIPFHYRIERYLTDLLRPIIKLPYIPRSKERIRSWILFDFYADSPENLKELLTIIKNHAYDNNRQFLYIRLQNNDSLIAKLTKAEFRVYKVPYYFLAKGAKIPSERDRIYLDIRDL